MASVAALVAPGRYGSASEVVRTSLRLLAKQERRSTVSTVPIGVLALAIPDAR